MRVMSKQYSEEEIQKALEKIREKHPEKATREQAINLLETAEEFSTMFLDKLTKKGKHKKK